MKKKYTSQVNVKAAGSGEIEAVFATTGIWDHDNDFTEPGAFGFQDGIVLEGWNHDYGLPVGRGHIFERGKQAIFNGRLFLDTSNGRDHFQALKAMGNTEFSYTFDILDAEQTTHNNRPGKILKRLEVIGVAPVTRGAGLGTRMLSLKNRTSPLRLSPAGSLAGVATLSSGWDAAELKHRLDAMFIRMLERDLVNLPSKSGPELNGDSRLDQYRAGLLADGHSAAWVEVMAAAQLAETAQYFERVYPAFASANPSWGRQQSESYWLSPVA